jgi:hypothetical protein
MTELSSRSAYRGFAWLRHLLFLPIVVRGSGEVGLVPRATRQSTYINYPWPDMAYRAAIAATLIINIGGTVWARMSARKVGLCKTIGPRWKCEKNFSTRPAIISGATTSGSFRVT